MQAAIKVMGQQATGGNVKAELALQTATVRGDSPEVWGIVGSPGLLVTGTSASTDNVAGGAVNQSTGIGTGKMWCRWGVAFSMSAAGAGSADVTLAVSTLSKGVIVGSWRGPLMTAAALIDATVPITGWVPAAWAQSVIAAILVLSAGANFRCKLVFRTAAFSQDAPGAWTATADQGGGAGDRLAADSNLAATVGSAVQWVQFGLTYWTTSGNPATTAEVAVTTAVRRT